MFLVAIFILCKLCVDKFLQRNNDIVKFQRFEIFAAQNFLPNQPSNKTAAANAQWQADC